MPLAFMVRNMAQELAEPTAESRGAVGRKPPVKADEPANRLEPFGETAKARGG